MPYDFSGMTLVQFQRRFQLEVDCISYVIDSEYPGGHVCSKCGRLVKVHTIISRGKSFSCGKCGRRWAPQSATMFHNSHTPLRKWFYAFWLVGHFPGDNLVSMFSQHMQVTYKTAWRIIEIAQNYYNPNYRSDRIAYTGITVLSNGRYRVRTKSGLNRNTDLGTYDTLDEARRAYLQVRIVRGKV